MTEVRTTVDEKIINQMAEPEKVEEAIKEEVVQDESPKSEETKVQDVYSDEVKETDSDQQATESQDKDEYGSPVSPKKTYSEEEVNELMRQRFNRTKKEETVRTQPQVQESQNDENWEAQLEGFVENTVKKMSQKEQQRAQETREQSMQVEFEDKMMRGMGKYKDFKEVVSKLPISDTMLLATRQMRDPAAFIYAASKTQAKEIERIASIPDPYHQAAEMGRLEERMRKIRAGTGSPKPVSQVSGDIENKSYIRPSVDDLVRKDALKKFGRRY